VKRLRIIVLGYIVRGPTGGLAWHHLQYVLGLAKLGHDVWFFEDSDDYGTCYNPETHQTGRDPTYGLRFAAELFSRVGLGDRWAYHDAHKREWHGALGSGAPALARTADVVLNLSNLNPLRRWVRYIPVRALIDTDPAFTQIRHIMDPERKALAAKHTVFFTFGENVPSSGSEIPDDGFPWQPTRQPVVLDAWPVTPAPAGGPFTTVMQWDSYENQRYGGRDFGMKSKSFDFIIEVPERVRDESFEIALGNVSAPRERLQQHGWKLRDPLVVARTPWSYQTYIQESKAEFTVAKHGYVVSESGWFSERSAGYLASGRPVVTQDTGFSSWLETGAGVLAFRDGEEARHAIREVSSRYDFHCRAARGIAEQYFDSATVLTQLLDACGANPRKRVREAATDGKA
jgi:hypothetical protein